MNVRHEPRFRIQAVSQRTEIPAPTLRAWERRYGIPAPARTKAAYRLYSEEDIELIERFKRLCDSGIAPVDAGEMLRAEAESAPRGEPTVDLTVRGEVGPDVTPYSRIVDDILRAAEAFDVTKLETEVRRALAMGSGVVVFERVLGPALRAIGESWHEGRLSVAHEHMSSEIIGTTLRQIVSLCAPSPARGLALLGCVEHEDHALPLYGAALAFAQAGLRPVILGARVGCIPLRTAIEEVRPRVIGLSVTVAPTSKAEAKELVKGYADACREVPWFVGGLGVRALAPLIEASGGIAFMGALSELTAELRRIVH